ncbi:hypothetical protein M378DRAFT_738640 [Amanita muscaria Koide BX008]|uniref:Derlin n=1 Tax=Amanita muscaria (strain Koide BX008) TaxID=946122 RepID=A0A0C2SI77_AMAMK|nr:hypothetical protein M378DRAFT_738640 [Amanita muscaria Koide BX008]
MPSVTRFLCLASLGINALVLMDLVHPNNLIFIREPVTQRYEIWRIFTSLFLGSGGFSYALELVILYLIAEQLESGSFSRKSADFAWQLIIIGTAIIIVCLPLNTQILTHPFLVALSCLCAALASSRARISLLDMFRVPVKYTPYIVVAFDILKCGPAAAVHSIVGMVVGCLCWWSMWAGRKPILRSLSRAPAWLRSLV